MNLDNRNTNDTSLQHNVTDADAFAVLTLLVILAAGFVYYVSH